MIYFVCAPATVNDSTPSGCYSSSTIMHEIVSIKLLFFLLRTCSNSSVSSDVFIAHELTAPSNLDPFAQKYPDAVDSTLFTQGVCLAFNRSGPFAGHYLAVGNSHGTVEIWDVETRGVVRILEGHVKAVEGLRYTVLLSPVEPKLIFPIAGLETIATFYPPPQMALP